MPQSDGAVVDPLPGIHAHATPALNALLRRFDRDCLDFEKERRTHEPWHEHRSGRWAVGAKMALSNFAHSVDILPSDQIRGQLDHCTHVKIVRRQAGAQIIEYDFGLLVQGCWNRPVLAHADLPRDEYQLRPGGHRRCMCVGPDRRVDCIGVQKRDHARTSASISVGRQREFVAQPLAKSSYPAIQPLGRALIDM
jgi:hypothetical protein